MVDSKRIQDWLNKAIEDLEASKILFNYNGSRSLVAFHTHQALEKAYKAYLLYKTEQLEEGHSLIFLNKQCANHDMDFASFKSASVRLNKYYIGTRYPADFPMHVNDDEARDAIKAADDILDLVRNKIPVCPRSLNGTD